MFLYDLLPNDLLENILGELSPDTHKAYQAAASKDLWKGVQASNKDRVVKRGRGIAKSLKRTPQVDEATNNHILISVFRKKGATQFQKIYVWRVSKDKFELEDANTHKKIEISAPLSRIKTSLGAKGFSERISEDANTNPADVVKLDIPLLIRVLEYAREDSKNDVDLHHVAERLIRLSKASKTLSMSDYEEIVPKEVTEAVVSAKEKILAPNIKVGDTVAVKSPHYEWMVKFGKLIRIGASGLAHVKLNKPLPNGDQTIAIPPSWLYSDVPDAWPNEKPRKIKKSTSTPTQGNLL